MKMKRDRLSLIRWLLIVVFCITEKVVILQVTTTVPPDRNLAPVIKKGQQDDKKEQEAKKKDIIKEVVTLETEDKWILKGDLYKVNYDEKFNLVGPTLLLLHMLPADRSSYNSIIPSLTEMGFNVLNLDWRGHGESIYKNEPDCPKGGHPTTAACWPKKEISYEKFTNEDYKNAIEDVDTAIKFLESSGVKKADIGIIGASIGANYAIQYAAENPQIKFIVLLSPGSNYHGVKTIESMKRLATSDVKILMYSTSTDEDTYSYESCQELEKEYKSVKDAKTENLSVTYKKYVGHGTEMLKHIATELTEKLKKLVK